LVTTSTCHGLFLEGVSEGVEEAEVKKRLAEVNSVQLAMARNPLSQPTCYQLIGWDEGLTALVVNVGRTFPCFRISQRLTEIHRVITMRLWSKWALNELGKFKRLKKFSFKERF
jgi:hypothetical protein